MVRTIGSATSHKDVLEHPDHISKHVLTKGLDAGTAYEILSIDIADVAVGIGAKLQIDQADADKQIAQAKAEERRAMVVALEQEMRARVVEAEVPQAMADAFRQGNLGIMDYYWMKNVQADTTMRNAIAEGASEPQAGRTREPGRPDEGAHVRGDHQSCACRLCGAPARSARALAAAAG
jgi:uncharacterized protein YqfA (UPF0365 family)